MIKRIVKMQFQPEHLPSFLRIFEETKDKIRSFPGCSHVELWQDLSIPNQVFTYSFWQSTDHLEKYRHSPLFQSTWARTKVLFSEKPQAWSVEVIDHVS